MRTAIYYLIGLSVIIGCGSKPAQPQPVVSVNAIPSAQSAPAPAIATPGFVPLVPRGGPPTAAQAPGPKCRVSEHVLGKLADPAGNLFPVNLVADSGGAFVTWRGPDGLWIQRLDVSGKPERRSLLGAVLANESPLLLLSKQEGIAAPTGEPPSLSEELVFIRMSSKEFHVTWIERASLRLTHERRVDRPEKLPNVLETVLRGDEVVMIGNQDRNLTFFRITKEGTSRSTSVTGPKLPGDPLMTPGLWDGEVAMAVSTIGGDFWLATQQGIKTVGRDILPPSDGPFVRAQIIDFDTGATTYGLKTFSKFLLSRSEDAELMEQKPANEAFRVGCTYGFSSDGWTGSHFLIACAAGTMEALNATVYAADCRK